MISELLKWTVGLPYAMWWVVYAEWVLWDMKKRNILDSFLVRLLTVYPEYANKTYWN